MIFKIKTEGGVTLTTTSNPDDIQGLIDQIDEQWLLDQGFSQEDIDDEDLSKIHAYPRVRPEEFDSHEQYRDAIRKVNDANPSSYVKYRAAPEPRRNLPPGDVVTSDSDGGG